MNSAKVAIITRTKNRNLLLLRALESVGRQTLTDWQLVIVNDGGDAAALDRLLAEQSHVAASQRTVIHNPQSLGMEAASNLGLRVGDSEFVVIHDDDDSWHPTFLERTIGYLTAPEAMARFAGVVTQCMRVSEVVEGDKVTIVGRELFNPTLTKIDLHEMVAGNQYPPVSFVYRRAAQQKVGFYREDLPPLADWEFNLRFLLKFQIGVLPEPLANYHHRDNDRGSAYANTVVGGLKTHQALDVFVRNEITARDIVSGATGLGELIQTARGFGGMYYEFQQLHNRLDRLEGLQLSGVREDLQRLAARADLGPDAAAEIRAALAKLVPVAAAPLRNPADSDPVFLEYVERIQKLLREGAITAGDRVAVFGASPFGERLVEVLARAGVSTECIFDNSPSRAGVRLAGVPVRRPGVLPAVTAVINASINHSAVIHQQVRALAEGHRLKLVSHNQPFEQLG